MVASEGGEMDGAMEAILLLIMRISVLTGVTLSFSSWRRTIPFESRMDEVGAMSNKIVLSRLQGLRQGESGAQYISQRRIRPIYIPANPHCETLQREQSHVTAKKCVVRLRW
jgi:hypothetical protein